MVKDFIIWTVILTIIFLIVAVIASVIPIGLNYLWWPVFIFTAYKFIEYWLKKTNNM